MASVVDIVSSFERIELYLLGSMRRTMLGHCQQEDTEGLNWAQWQAEMLRGLDEYKRETPGFDWRTQNEAIEAAIRQAYGTGQSEQELEILKALSGTLRDTQGRLGTISTGGVFFKQNATKLNALIQETLTPMRKAETAITGAAHAVYRQAIFDAQAFAATGAMTTYQAVDRAVNALTANGLRCVEYSNGRRVSLAGYAEMSVRTANHRAAMAGKASKRDEWGIHTVIVSSHAGACPFCSQWQGRVFVDDVYGAGTAAEARDSGYPLLSSAVAGGLFHPNCRDTTSTYFEGITTASAEGRSEPDLAEQTRRYNLEQRQRYMERQVKTYSRREATALDPGNREQAANMRDAWLDRLTGFVYENDDCLALDAGRLRAYVGPSEG